MSFEELRAKSRGWLNRDWAVESKQRIVEEPQTHKVDEPAITAVAETSEAVEIMQDSQPKSDTQDSLSTQLETTVSVDIGREGKNGRTKKLKIREVKGETQTSMSNPSYNLGRLVD